MVVVVLDDFVVSNALFAAARRSQGSGNLLGSTGRGDGCGGWCSAVLLAKIGDLLEVEAHHGTPVLR